MRHQSAHDLAELRAQAVGAPIPEWAFGGNPEGLGQLAGWGVTRDETGWRIQNRESVRGRSPKLITVWDSGSDSHPDDESTYASLRNLAEFDGILKEDLWERAVAYREMLAAHYPNDLTAMLTGVMALFGGARSADDLPRIASVVIPELRENALPRARIFGVQLSSSLGGRLQMPRVFLRVDDNAPKPSTTDIFFQSSHHLMPDSMVGLGPFLDPLFTSLAPRVWGLNVPKIGGSISIVFGETIPGRRKFPVDLLDTGAPRGGDEFEDHVGPEGLGSYKNALRWWTKRLELLFSHATEPENNAMHGDWDPAVAQQRLLTLTLLFRSCQALATSSDSHTRRLLLFNVLDQLEGLNSRWKWTDCTTPDAIGERISRIAARMPADVQAVLMPRARGALEGVRSLPCGFFAEELLEEGQIRLPVKSGGTALTPLNRAASEWLRVIRNSQHGFEKSIGPRQAALLAAHNGHIDTRVPDIAWVHLLYMLAFPEDLATGKRQRKISQR